MKSLSFKIRGVVPLLCHNGQTADPLNDFAISLKQVAKKKIKSEEDHIEMGRIEFLAGLYVEGGKPCLPGHVIEAALIEGAKRTKQGKLAKLGLLVEKNSILIYEGPKDPDEMFKNKAFQFRFPVRVGLSKVMRTRPRFDTWETKIEIQYDPLVFSATDVKDILETTGRSVGIGDWRPKFGRFEVV